MKSRISKAYRGDKHIGWKKTVGGMSKMLVYGISPPDETKAQKIALALEARWAIAQLEGRSALTDEDFEQAKALVEGKQVQTAVLQQAALAAVPALATSNSPSLPEGGGRMLHDAIDEFVEWKMKSLKADRSNGDDVVNKCDRIRRAREVIVNLPLVSLGRKELDDWLQAIASAKSKFNGEPLGSTTIRNYTQVVRDALIKFAEWGWWQTPNLWERAFKPYTLSKLQTPKERKKSRKRPVYHGVSELRVLWHMATPFEKAMIALAVWAGHTQKEIAALAFDEIRDEAGGLYIDRDRHKTGVPGRWWIPPEAAAVIRQVVGRMPKDLARNPDQVAFLTDGGKPIVRRSAENPRSKTDVIGDRVWPSLLRAAGHHGVRHISFKQARKGTAQLIRDEWGKEVSRTFLAQSDEDVQDRHYTRPSLEKCEKAVRQLYPTLREMFKPIKATDWDEVRDKISEEIAAASPATMSLA